jgi:hypothetical protein
VGDIIIKDGKGSGVSAKVSSTNKLSVLAVSEDIAAHHAFEGNAYNINTGTINLTSANKSALLYVKNLEEKDLIINAFFYLLGNSNITGVDTLVQVERNPTGGDLISGGTAFLPVNRHFGSKNTLNVTCLKGAEGDALSGADDIVVESLFSGVGRKTVAVGAIIVPRGTSVGVTITPPTGNTSMNVQMALAAYLVEEDTTDRG